MGTVKCKSIGLLLIFNVYYYLELKKKKNQGLQMSWSVEKTLCFLVIFLLFSRTKSQVISDTKAVDGTLKHMVHLKRFVKFFNEENEEQTKYARVSGSLVKLNWILTAAHCVADFDKTVNGTTTQYFFYKVDVIAGTKNYKVRSNATTQQRTIYKNDIIVHEYYDPISKLYDVALIYTKKKFEVTDTVEPAKLLEPWMKFDADAKCVVQGWGRRKLIRNEDDLLQYHPQFPNTARQGAINILNGEICKRLYKRSKNIRFNENLHFCYGCKSGRCEQAAPGDSGTPVVCALKKGENPLIDGVVFAVHSCGCSDVRKLCRPEGPSFGTDVRKIKSWIEKEAYKRLNGNEPPGSIYPYFIAGAIIVATAVKYFY